MFPRLRDWHAYLFRERDPERSGLVYIRHPWESGMDNSPLWDASLQRIQPRPEEIPAYRRVDTTIVDAADRPTNVEYDRYMYLVKLFADREYDEARIFPDCPYLIQDVLVQHIAVPGRSRPGRDRRAAWRGSGAVRRQGRGHRPGAQ